MPLVRLTARLVAAGLRCSAWLLGFKPEKMALDEQTFIDRCTKAALKRPEVGELVQRKRCSVALTVAA